MNKILFFLLSIQFIFAKPFYIGVGEFGACPSKYGSSYSKNCPFEKRKPLFEFLKKEAPNVNAVSVWITRNWQKNWYPAKTVNKFIKNGYTPVFIFYWFGDQISPEYVKTHKKEYFKSLKRFSDYLKEINGTKIVILNPEYNENGMDGSKNFDLLQARSILILKENNNTKVGICPGDFGDYSKIWDAYNWNIFAPSMRLSSKLADFIAFQEMRALTKNRAEEILDTPLRALAFASYLHQKYGKPTFLAYLAVSSYKNIKLQTNVYKEFSRLLPMFRHTAGLIGINIFNYIDVPGHTGYFGKAEKHFGIKFSNGKEKPAFKEFLKFKKSE
jgi:hypothetical protein